MRIPTRPKDLKNFLFCSIVLGIAFSLVNVLSTLNYGMNYGVAEIFASIIAGFIWGFVIIGIIYLIIFFIRFCKGEKKREPESEVKILTENECRAIFLQTVNAVPQIRYETQHLTIPEQYLHINKVKFLKQAIYDVTGAEFTDDEVKYYFYMWFKDEKKKQNINDLFE